MKSISLTSHKLHNLHMCQRVVTGDSHVFYGIEFELNFSSSKIYLHAHSFKILCKMKLIYIAYVAILCFLCVCAPNYIIFVCTSVHTRVQT